MGEIRERRPGSHGHRTFLPGLLVRLSHLLHERYVSHAFVAAVLHDIIVHTVRERARPYVGSCRE